MTHGVPADGGRTAIRGRNRLSATVAAALFALTVTGAQALADGGGVGTTEPAEVTDVLCVSDCGGPRKATAGSEVRIEGRRLADSVSVAFAAEGGGRSEVRARQASRRSVGAVVPEDAASGRVVAIDSAGGEVRSPRQITIVDPGDTEPGVTEEFEVTSVEAAPRRAFYGAGRGTRVRFSFDAPGPTNVRIAVTKRETGREVASWIVRGAQPFTDNVSRWNGKSAEGKVLDKGRFAFSVSDTGAGARAKTEASARFDVYPEKFPVRGKHGFGDGFGAGRGHQGADIFADCGTRLVAARAGKVQYSGYQSSAGNYVVIDTKGSGIDHAYMHLTKPSKVRAGEKVKTGQTIGKVGETGNAQGCHLHFEIWSAPGWYEGGSAQSNVMRQVKKWDGWS